MYVFGKNTIYIRITSETELKPWHLTLTQTELEAEDTPKSRILQFRPE